MLASQADHTGSIPATCSKRKKETMNQKYNNFYSETYEIERKYELISGEDLNNEFRLKTKERVDYIMKDLHIVINNIDSFKAIMSSEGENIRNFSPAFISSFIYSSLSANIILISNLFDRNKKVLSLHKLVNSIEADKQHLECRVYERRKNKDIDWKLKHEGELQNDINAWKSEINSLQNDIVNKIDALRDKIYAHKDISFLESRQEISLSFEEFESFVNKIIDLLNKISSSIFYSTFAFLNHYHPDIEQTLTMINRYRKYKTEVTKLIRNGTIQKK